MPRFARVPSRSARWIAVASVLAIGPSADLRAQAPAALDVQTSLAPHHDHFRSRVDAAARLAVARYTEWLGPLDGSPITVGDPPARVVLALPWRSAAGLMEVESQAAYGAAQLWFAHVTEKDGSRFVDGAAWYLQSRVVDTLFDHTYLKTAHSMDGARFFGGVLPWAFPALPLGRWSAGLGRLEWLQSERARPWPRSGRRLPLDVDGAALRSALAFGTLERYLGWPTLQAALNVVSQTRTPITATEAVRIVSDAAGQDLSWFLNAAFDPRVRFSYAVASLESEAAQPPCDSHCVTTRVTVVRSGEGRFPLPLEVEFEDGRRIRTGWDGLETARTFEFASASPAIAARLDPDRVLLLDDNYLDGARVSPVTTNVPIAKWMARWVVWLQDAMLTYASLS